MFFPRRKSNLKHWDLSRAVLLIPANREGEAGQLQETEGSGVLGKVSKAIS
jgi:hypothetical protein